MASRCGGVGGRPSTQCTKDDECTEAPGFAAARRPWTNDLVDGANGDGHLEIASSGWLDPLWVCDQALRQLVSAYTSVETPGTNK